MNRRVRLAISVGLVAMVAVGSAAVALTRDKLGLLPVRSQHGIVREEPPMVTLAREDLAGLLGIDVGDVSVLSIEPVEWPDTSLGNPQPGLFYLQVITPGYKLILEGADFPYTYHTDLNQHVELVNESEQPAA
ncbi:MAG: hypothetical protein O2812_01920 [Chloroflexi bacterium]|nr:hypothetical protein [Chloroflexota bacterium]